LLLLFKEDEPLAKLAVTVEKKAEGL